MYSVDNDVVEGLRELVHRPVWQGEPTVLLFAREEDGEAAQAWWEDTVGEGPRIRLRNVRADAGAPEKVPTPDGRMVVPGEGRSNLEPADVVLVDGRHPDVAAFWRRYSDADVHELEVSA